MLSGREPLWTFVDTALGSSVAHTRPLDNQKKGLRRVNGYADEPWMDRDRSGHPQQKTSMAELMLRHRNPNNE